MKMGFVVCEEPFVCGKLCDAVATPSPKQSNMSLTRDYVTCMNLLQNSNSFTWAQVTNIVCRVVYAIALKFVPSDTE